jgi:hypothetical protein
VSERGHVSVRSRRWPTDSVRSCRERVSAHAGLAQYSTAHAVDDIEAVRQWLAYPALQVIDASYGSRAALTLCAATRRVCAAPSSWASCLRISAGRCTTHATRSARWSCCSMSAWQTRGGRRIPTSTLGNGAGAGGARPDTAAGDAQAPIEAPRCASRSRHRTHWARRSTGGSRRRSGAQDDPRSAEPDPGLGDRSPAPGRRYRALPQAHRRLMLLATATLIPAQTGSWTCWP